MKQIIVGFFVFLLGLFLFLSPTYAADIRGGETIRVSGEKTFRDLYLFGETITLDAPVEHDVVAAGGKLLLHGSTTGSTMVAGGELQIGTNIAGSLRAAGGDIQITGPVGRDAFVAGGEILITETASISGDLIITGGEVIVNSPVRGKVILNAGTVTINNRVGGNVDARVGKLTLGEQALIEGNLHYESAEKVSRLPGAQVRGETAYIEQESDHFGETLANFLTKLAVYKLITDVLVALLFVFLFNEFTKRILERASASPLKNAAIGAGVLFFMPLLGLMLFLLFWLGIVTFLLYGLFIFVALILMKLLLGWWILSWWERRNKHVYALDWKAAIVGPLTAFVLFIIPGIGLLLLFIIFLITLGSIMREFTRLSSAPVDQEPRLPASRLTTKSTRKKK